MSDIAYKDKGSILRPIKTLGFFGRKAVTEKLEPRPAAANYRGFHVNDWEVCIGCSTCQKVCDNAAISMVKIPSLPEDPVKGIRNERPAIDYGRCCWCALCVDLCPTGSISLSREYVHTCVDAELDSYVILPDSSGMHGTPFPKGWAKSDDADMVALKRSAMAEMPPEERVDNFEEIVAGYTDNQAIIEASRCVQCGMCHDACPTHMHAPEYIRAIWQGEFEQAVREIYRTNPFAHTCGRVCTHRCETACSIGKRGEPIAIRWLKRYAMDAFTPEQVAALEAMAAWIRDDDGLRETMLGRPASEIPSTAWRRTRDRTGTGVTLDGGSRLVVMLDGGGVGKGGVATILVNGEQVAKGRIEKTEPNVFSADETADVGLDDAHFFRGQIQHPGQVDPERILVDPRTVAVAADAEQLAAGRLRAADGAKPVSAVRRDLRRRREGQGRRPRCPSRRMGRHWQTARSLVYLVDNAEACGSTGRVPGEAEAA